MSTRKFIVAFAPEMWYSRPVTAIKLVRALTKDKMRELLWGPLAEMACQRRNAVACPLALAFCSLDVDTPLYLRWAVRGFTAEWVLDRPCDSCVLKPWQARLAQEFDGLAIETEEDGHRKTRLYFTGREVYDLLAEEYL